MQKGGAERVISLLLKELAQKEELSLHLILLEDGIDYELPKNITVTVLSTNDKHGVQKLLELPFVAWKVFRYTKQHNISTVMSFLYRPNYINILSKLFGSQHRAIINIRSTTSRYLREGFLGKVNLFLIKSLFNKADLIVSNSHGVDEDLKSLIPANAKTKVIHNPVDIEYINRKKENCEDVAFEFEEDKKYIISLGRLIPLKRNRDLIDAFNVLQKEDSSLELLFVGEGKLKSELVEYCSELNIAQKVHFLGNVTNPFYYLHKSDLFVMTSEVEGFPNVLVEAMACGLPVISSDCKSGPREILGENEYGLLYDVGDLTALIKSMQYYLYDESIDLTEIKMKNLQRLEDFEIGKIMKEFEGVL